jgi:hypothetical protein
MNLDNNEKIFIIGVTSIIGLLIYLGYKLKKDEILK